MGKCLARLSLGSSLSMFLAQVRAKDNSSLSLTILAIINCNTTHCCVTMISPGPLSFKSTSAISKPSDELYRFHSGFAIISKLMARH